MIPELGQVALIIALVIAVLQSIIPLYGAWRGDSLAMNFARPAAAGQLLFVLLAYVCLTYAFLTDDFSVTYVALNSNSALPWYYQLSAVWAGHEGSLVLWALMLTGWGFAVAVFSRDLPDEMLSRVLAVMGMIGCGFLLFTLMTSNPFDRQLPFHPADGNDLNPLLQDFGLIVHPPTLYMGYVGFSVAFAFAIAALLGGRLDAAWARWSRPWTLAAWAFLSLGIILGSWWAYYELGWGGWWFWDPVENASFMPWLVGTALLHSLAVTEKRGVFKSWTVLLAIAAFSLSLLGTFLVRSGVLTSVHAFATDPERGVFILGFLLVVVGGSLLLYALRAPVVKSRIGFDLWSRETFLLVNNVILVVATLMVLLGTLYPLVLDAMTGAIVSVGPPYYNALFVPLMALLMAAMGIGMLSRWKETPLRWLWGQIKWVLVLSAIGAIAMALWVGDHYFAIGSLMLLVIWVVGLSLKDIHNKTRHKGWWPGLRGLPRSYWGMTLAHIGMAVCAVGVVGASLFDSQRDLRMAPGESVELGGYRFEYEGIQPRVSSNWQSDVAIINVYKGERRITQMRPEKRLFTVQNQMMTEAAIHAGFTRDLFVAMGEPLGNDAWAMRVHIKPFVRWIWLGGLLMVFGGLLAATDKRYRLKARRARSQSAKLEQADA
ncbi:heme lyase CcmF/NrfE family subunit [Halopseudomonas salegens]|uniref:Cytochrome c-type biogenesis protein CcmF n=1 Tax=Halopseudomonas salegens TaxID=1434072 RepID=A0A1H2FXS1_9GAMM|nr:heme lyase CcmF/NrfE family subunit [Halopseudomonas salegens]SDU12131.1 cytochrome c-type biogenesis protein CcmF [Halopseudomonas salegens]